LGPIIAVLSFRFRRLLLAQLIRRGVTLLRAIDL
jgi:hypothetical protein